MRRTACLTTIVLALAAVAGFAAAPARAAQPDLAPTPPMGWNDWYAFQCNINEQLVTQTADAMVSSGMRDAGYRYVNLDDCWMAPQRDAQGNLQADPQKFPHGIKWLADYVHARGLKLGVYEDVGTKTCAGYPGSYGHDEQDARTFASWGVDFVKVDWCNVPFGDFPGMSQQDVAKKLYTDYSQALRDSGRPILFSICEWDPALKPWTWAPDISAMWRTNHDYGNNWSFILRNLDGEAGLARYAGPGHWNDPDILQVGLPGGLTDDEDQSHFSLWAMLAAPLQAGNDLRTMSERTREILTNREVIAIDQDTLGAEGDRISRDGDADVWARPLANGDHAVVLLNRGEEPLTIATTASAIGLPSAPAYALRDVWRHETLQSAGRIAATVPPHGVAMYRVTPLQAVDPGLAPDVALGPPSAPSVAPGVDGTILEPGQTTTVTSTFENDGATGLDDVSLKLSAPAGWDVQPVTTSTPSLGRGRSFTASWRVTPPADANGKSTLSVTADYSWSGHAATASAQRDVTVEHLTAPTGSPYVSDLDWIDSRSDFSYVHRDVNYYGGPLSIHGTTYAKGLWANANATVDVYLGGNCSRFTSDLGMDDSDRSQGTIDYQVYLDGTKVYDSGVVRNATPTIHLDQDVSGAKVLRLVVTDAGDGINYDNADFGGARLTCAS